MLFSPLIFFFLIPSPAHSRFSRSDVGGISSSDIIHLNQSVFVIG